MTRDGGVPPEVAVFLAAVLREEGFEQWLRTPISALGGRTPSEALEAGDGPAVLELVKRYSDPSFT